MSEEVAALLDAAHDRILSEGWGQNSLPYRVKFGDASTVCLVQAINAAAGHPEHSCSAFWALLPQQAGAALVSHLGLVPQYDGEPISNALWRWNDYPSRTIDEVLDAFRHAAKNERA